MESVPDPRVADLVGIIISIADNLRLEEVFSESVLFDRGVYQFKMPAQQSLRSISESLNRYPIAAYTYEDLASIADVLRSVKQIHDHEEAESFKHSLSYFAKTLQDIGMNYERQKAADDRTEIEYLTRRVQEVKDQLASLGTLTNQGKNYVADLEVLYQSTGTIRGTLETELNKTIESRRQFEKRLTEINAFAEELKLREKRLNEFEERISEASKAFTTYDNKVADAVSATNDIIGKTGQINKLLKDAENAVGLEATAGISAAFVKQRDDIKGGLTFWLVCTLVFVLLGGVATVWILTGFGLSNPDSWPSIIGRIVAVGIMVGGATFSSQQYIRQKSIVDDYSYKVVLSQSILAFTDEIRRRSDDTQVIAYLTKVLGEIHKDPQRPRKANVNSAIKMELLDKITDKLNFNK